MFFLLRLTFFLGLVLWSITPKPEAPRSSAPAVAGMAAAADGSVSARRITKAVEGYCETNPKVCLAIASKIAASGKDVDMRQILALAAGTVAGASPGTLTGADRAIPARSGALR
ncbi:MAG: hypothetical protein AB7F96_02635 [Beijerinckiaceae bacterium]